MRNLILVFIVLFLVSGCEKSSPAGGTLVTTEDFVLMPGYDWVTADEDQIYVIRTHEELRNYIESAGGEAEVETEIDIDFGKYSLLLASGRTYSGIRDITNTLIRHADGSMTFGIKIFHDAACVSPKWHVPVLISPTLNSGQIKLNVEKIW